MYYSEVLDKYFYDIESIVEETKYKEISLEDLLLYHCKQMGPIELDLNDILESDLPEDSTAEDVLSIEVIEALDKLNRLLSMNPPKTWYNCKIDVNLEQIQ